MSPINLLMHHELGIAEAIVVYGAAALASAGMLVIRVKEFFTRRKREPKAKQDG